MRTGIALLGFLMFGLLAWSYPPSVHARFIRPDLEKIPVDRLVKNLEELAEKSPKDAQIVYNLARLHAMAYATKSAECDVWKGRIQNGPWFGFTPSIVPFAPRATKDEQALKTASAHLDKAIEAYHRALKLQPDNLQAKLGLAWSFDQKGTKEAAIEGYRTIIDKSWPMEMNRKSGPLGGHFITVEAAGYLIPLLDAKKNATEIDELKQHSEKLKRLPRPVTPIAIPLRDGLTARDIENRQASVAFDADGTGLPQKRTWITPQAGWLVYAPKGKETITSALQMFGNVGFWLFWEHGYQALQTLDDNGDGQISGAELNNLAIWCDLNGDGICDPGEVQPLSAFGIVALSCRCQQDTAHPDRIWYSPRGVTFANGATRPTFDIILHPNEGR